MPQPRTRKAPRAADAPIAVALEDEAIGVLIFMREALVNQLNAITRVLEKRQK